MRGSLFLFFFFFAANSPHATRRSPFYRGGQTSGNDGLREGEERRKHIAQEYAYNAIYPSSPHPWRHTRNVPSSFLRLPSARSTAPSFLRVNPLPRIQRMYIRIYIFQHIFQTRVSKPSWPRNTKTVRNFLFESFSSFISSYVLSSLLFWYEFSRAMKIRQWKSFNKTLRDRNGRRWWLLTDINENWNNINRGRVMEGWKRDFY